MVKLNNISDIMVLLIDSQGQTGIILDEGEVSAKLFDLSSGLAGELFQKMVNYNKRLAFVVSDLSQYSKNLPMSMKHILISGFTQTGPTLKNGSRAEQSS